MLILNVLYACALHKVRGRGSVVTRHTAQLSNAECGAFVSRGAGGPFDNWHVHNGQIFKVKFTPQQTT